MRWITFSLYEAQQRGAMNVGLAVAPQAKVTSFGINVGKGAIRT